MNTTYELHNNRTAVVRFDINVEQVRLLWRTVSIRDIEMSNG